MSTSVDSQSFRDRHAADLGPHHTMVSLADLTGGSLMQPDGGPPSIFDRVGGKLIGRPELWTSARAILRSDADVVYCTGEDIGIPLALLASVRRRSMAVGIYFLAPQRPRAKFLGRAALRLLPNTFAATGTEAKLTFLEGWLKDSVNELVLAHEQTDTTFFRPADVAGATNPAATRVHIASCGLEQRDYVKLSKALGRLNRDGIEVTAGVCAVSPNFSDRTRVEIPETLPTGMEMRHYEFDELRDLYRTATVTVIPLLENEYSAGLTTMLEAIACGSPVIMTRTEGLASDFIDQDLIVGIPPGDDEALADAIKMVIKEPDEHRERAERARNWVLTNHSSTPYVETLAAAAERAGATQH